MVDKTKVEVASWRLLRATADRRPCLPISDLIDATDAEAAYAVQQRVNQVRIAAGATVVGRKIGLTAAAVRRQLGVSQPDFGVLFDDMDLSGAAVVPMERLLQPKVEAEIAFVLGADLVDGPLDYAQVRTAVATAVAALEIVDSRIADWKISFADTVADNASSGLFVLGDQHVPLDEFTPIAAMMELTCDGEVVSKGTGSACLGDPLNALAWLARTALAFGDPLRAGQIVLSGALGPMVPVTAGLEVHAVISGLGEVSATFGAGK